MERQHPADSATLRGARAVGIVCATLFILPVVLSIAFPSAFLFPPYNRIYERMIAAVLLAFALGLLLALRDPVRNAGVFAVVGLATGLLGGAVVYALVVDRADPLHWVAQVPILAAITATLEITYTRLRRPTPIVQVTDLRKRYGDIEAVRGISFFVEPGEVFGLLGPNGAGKTTTVEILEGLRRADGGSATVAGVDVFRDPSGVKRRIGVQLQASAFPDNLTARETVRFFAACYDLVVDELALLRQVELEERARQPQAKLSGGQRQRLSIATALVNQPRVLFLDEPTTGLDPQARRNLWELIRSIQARGTTVFLTTHYLDEAEILCDRVAIMDEGNIVALAPPRKLIDDLLERGFAKPVLQQKANLEDVFLDLTGHEIRDA